MAITNKDIEALKLLYLCCPSFNIGLGRDRQDFQESRDTRGVAEQWKVDAPDSSRLWRTEVGLSLEEVIHKILNKIAKTYDSN